MKKREGRKKTGRSATITPRDDAIMQALFFCRYLSTAQLAILFFNSKSAARRRLANKGYLEPRSLYATITLSRAVSIGISRGDPELPKCGMLRYGADRHTLDHRV